MLCTEERGRLINALQQDGDLRVLRRLDLSRLAPQSIAKGTANLSVAAVVDVETTGLDANDDKIIELAVRRIWFCGDAIAAIEPGWSWLEDPGLPLPPAIQKLTGLLDNELAGQSIDEEQAVALLISADVVIAHSAAFDRKFVERRLPGAAGLRWACSCRDIDWEGRGFEGRSLRWLGMQTGFFYDAHRAANDVDAVIGLLSVVNGDGARSTLSELIENAFRSTVLVEAVGADFAVKDLLRQRGYWWNARAKVWSIEIDIDDVGDENRWLARHVYSLEKRPRALGPRLTPRTARERYA